MKLLRYGSGSAVAVAIGNFDGYHLGHQSLIKKLKEEFEGPRGVMSFYPHPKLYFAKNLKNEKLSNFRTKLKLAEGFGLNFLAYVRFSEKLRNMSPEEFVKELLVNQYRAKCVVVGDDWRFGKERAGDVNLLQKLATKYDFDLHVMSMLEVSGAKVSSSAIREALNDGNLEEVKNFLGRSFGFWSKVISGDKRGREIGFPTANLNTHTQKLPPKGVYSSWATLNGTTYEAVTNVGERPTFDGKGVRAETHLLNYQGPDFYNHEIFVSFEEFIRKEQKFSGIEELKNQISRDTQTAISSLRALGK